LRQSHGNGPLDQSEIQHSDWDPLRRVPLVFCGRRQLSLHTGERRNDFTGGPTEPGLVSRRWAAGCAGCRGNCVPPIRRSHFTLGRRHPQGSRQSGKLVASPHRCAIFLGISNDLAAPALAAFEPAVNSPAERRLLWTALAVLASGTVTVEIPFLLRLGTLARMSIESQLSMVGPGLGILAACGAILLLRGRTMSPTRACFVGLDGVYLANAGLCLVVYAPMHESGWFATMTIVWFMAAEVAWNCISPGRPLAAVTAIPS
jgi:hypothetical protein